VFFPNIPPSGFSRGSHARILRRSREIYKKQIGRDGFRHRDDHNVIEGAVRLKMRHPDDVFIGVEVTTYFPEDGTKIHVLVWGLSEGQFRVIDKIRSKHI